MANAIYGAYKGSLLLGDADTNPISGVVRAVMLSAGYTYNASHKFLSDIPTTARVVISDPLASKTINALLGSFDSADPTMSAVTGATVVAVVLFIDTGDETASRLVTFHDSGLTGIPFTPSGVNVTLVVNASGWFTL